MTASAVPTCRDPRAQPGSLGVGVTLAVTLAMLLVARSAQAALTDENVLVVYNSQSAVDSDGDTVSDSQQIFNHYQSLYTNVHGLDLNDPSIDGAMFNGTLDYQEYIDLIRDPIRTYLDDENLEQQVSVITMTKGLPHRISDDDNVGIGDGSTGSEFNSLDATYAAIESELTLLWQNLRGTGTLADDSLIKADTGPGVGVSNEDDTPANKGFDSASDNGVVNPYFQSTDSITGFDRSTVTEQRLFELQTSGPDSGYSEMNNFTLTPGPSISLDGLADAGAILLTARLDGEHVDDVIGALNRAQNISYDQATDLIIIDENEAFGEIEGQDYENAVSNLAGIYDNVLFNDGSPFLVGDTPVPSVTSGTATPLSDPIAALATYGGNHNGTGNSLNGFLNTYAGQLVNGAIYSGLESYNARPFNGNFEFNDQANLEEWFAAGGTFAVGNVYEPFGNTVAQNQYLLPNWFAGELTWVEAAWAATPYLSWQQTVLGDPLARAVVIIPEPAAAALLLTGLPVVFGRRRR